ncbi:MAG: hypothetical protein Kow0080_03700 [Candidatus Promineifilaceae bacterium]
MPEAGMVHALKQIHSMLTKNGRLIDIHPTPEPAAITVRIGSHKQLVGWITEDSDYTTYAAADNALTTAVSQGHYIRQAAATFTFTTTADTLADLNQYLADYWTDGRIEPQVAGHIEEILLTTPLQETELILTEKINITCLLPKNKQI